MAFRSIIVLLCVGAFVGLSQAAPAAQPEDLKCIAETKTFLANIELPVDTTRVLDATQGIAVKGHPDSLAITTNDIISACKALTPLVEQVKAAKPCLEKVKFFDSKTFDQVLDEDEKLRTIAHGIMVCGYFHRV